MNTTTNRSETIAFSARPRGKHLRELFLDELADMKDAESQLTFAIPLLVKAARSEDLKTLLQIHLKETKGHVECVKSVAESLGVKLPKRTCRAMESLIKEGVMLVVKNVTSPCRDIALIAATQKIEHYEIASYGTLCAWAQEMGYIHELAKLTSTLNQEKTADALLTGVAKGAAPLQQVIEGISLHKAGAPAPPSAITRSAKTRELVDDSNLIRKRRQKQGS